MSINPTNICFGTECPICLEDFQEGETLKKLNPCNHLYHKACIDSYIGRKHVFECPYCRQKVNKKNITDLTFKKPAPTQSSIPRLDRRIASKAFSRGLVGKMASAEKIQQLMNES